MCKRAVLLICLCVLSAPAWATLYYVRSSGGSDGNTGFSFAQGFATIQFAWDTVDDNDTILICADGTHLPVTNTIDVDYTQSTAMTPIDMRGCAADGTDDGTLATISGASQGAGIDIITVAGVDAVGTIENIRFTAAKGNALYGGAIWWNIINCRFDNAGESGIYINSSNVICHLYDCEIDNNDDYGFRNNGTYYRGLVVMENCSIHDNGNNGVIASPGQRGSIRQDSSFINCLFYDNAASGLYLVSALGALPIVRHCTFHGNTGSGLEINANGLYSRLRIHDCIFTDNTAYGIDLNSNATANLADFKRICTNGNGTAAIDVDAGVVAGEGNLTVDPDFVSVVDGSEDFTPQEATLNVSEAMPTGGTSHFWIGMIQPEPAAGGGGAVQLVGGGLVR